MTFLEFSGIVLDWALSMALLFIGVAFALTIFRIFKGPTLPDRVLGLDVLTGAGGRVETLEGTPLRYGKHADKGRGGFANPPFIAYGGDRSA